MSLFTENMIKVCEESGKVNYRTNDFFRKIYGTHYLSPYRNHFPEQKINYKNKSLRFNMFYLAIFFPSAKSLF